MPRAASCANAAGLSDARLAPVSAKVTTRPGAIDLKTPIWEAVRRTEPAPTRLTASTPLRVGTPEVKSALPLTTTVTVSLPAAKSISEKPAN